MPLIMACKPCVISLLPESQTSSPTISPVLLAITAALIFLEQCSLISALGFYIHSVFSLKSFSLKYFFVTQVSSQMLFSHEISLTAVSDIFLLLPRVPPFYSITLFYFIHGISVWNYPNYLLLSFPSKENESSMSGLSLLWLHWTQNDGSLQRSILAGDLTGVGPGWGCFGLL